VFPFNSLTFALWCALVDTCFVTSDNATQKGVTCLVILIQKVVTHVQMVMPVLFCGLF
jgi:hypothetical protein